MKAIKNANPKSINSLSKSKYIVYTRARYCFSLVCTFKKAIKNFEVKADVHWGWEHDVKSLQ